MALIGDSHAEHWRIAVATIARKRNWELIEMYLGGCAANYAPTVRFEGRPQAPERCLNWSHRVSAHLQEFHPSLVLTTAFVRATQWAPATAAQGFLDIWRDWQKFATVEVLADVPGTGGKNGPECLAIHAGDPLACATDRATALPDDELDQAVRLTARSAHPVRLIDLSRYFCDRSTCYAVVGGVPVYFDDDHMTLRFGVTLAPYLQAGPRLTWRERRLLAPSGSNYARPMLEQKRVLATSIPGPKSAGSAAAQAGRSVRGVGTGLPVYIERAAGGILRDVDGNQLIDFGSGIAVTTVGNGNQRVIDAVTRQINDFTPHLLHGDALRGVPPGRRGAWPRSTPGDHEKRSALFNSGSEAVENAVKVARHYTGRQAVVAFDHAYHGRTNLTMGLTAKSMPYKHRFGPFASEIYRVQMAYPYRWPTGAGAVRRRGVRGVRVRCSRPDRRGEHRRRHPRADPGRGWLHRARARLHEAGRRLVPRARHPLRR